MIQSRRRKVEREPTIALINIVFLILIFFMVAGTLAKTPQGEIEFISSSQLDCCAPADALVISSRGELTYDGIAFASVAEFAANQKSDEWTVRILPGKDLPAVQLLENMEQLKSAGATKLLLITENGD